MQKKLWNNSMAFNMAAMGLFTLGIGLRVKLLVNPIWHGLFYVP